MIVVPALHRLDAEYRAAKLNYANLFALAEGEDLKNLRNLERDYTVKSFSGLSGFFNTIFKFFGARYISQDSLAQKSSDHRFAFMLEVSTLETARLQRVKNVINQNITPLISDIEDDQQQNVSLLRQLHQLTAIFRALFPNEDNSEVTKGLDILSNVPRETLALITNGEQ